MTWSRDGIPHQITSRPFVTEKTIFIKKNMNVLDVIISARTSKEFKDSKMKIDGRFSMEFPSPFFNKNVLYNIEVCYLK